MNSRALIALAFILGTTVISGGAWLLWTKARVEPPRPVDSARLAPADGICRDNADCPVGQFCTSFLSEHVDCFPDACATDTDCRAGEVCRTVSSITGERGPRLCVLAGTRGEGERCSDKPQSPGEGCRAELLCNFPFCGRPCDLSDAASCPRGFACRDGHGGPSCTPDCNETGCPEGRSCLRFETARPERAFRVCAELLGENCLRDGCSAGLRCRYSYLPRLDQAAMKCLPECGPGGRCPEGHVCHEGTCLRRCTPSRDDCGPAMACIGINRDKFTYACQLYPTRQPR